MLNNSPRNVLKHHVGAPLTPTEALIVALLNDAVDGGVYRVCANLSRASKRGGARLEPGLALMSASQLRTAIGPDQAQSLAERLGVDVALLLHGLAAPIASIDAKLRSLPFRNSPP